MSEDLYATAARALEQGHGGEAVDFLTRALRQPDLARDDRAQLRCAMAEAWLLQDDLEKASAALGPEPQERERLNPARLSDLWRMHGRLAVTRGEASRGIAFLTRALRLAQRAHDSRAIGLAHYELGICDRQVGEAAIVREHITAAASALHAAGDRRSLAMVHSLSGIALAQEGRLDEAMSALRQAERLALMVEAGDVLGTVCGNQANVALMQHRHEQALALAERSVELQEQAGKPHGLGVALASLGQICVRVGNLKRADEVLHRALEVRSPLQFMRETTGAVFDSLAQIYLIRGAHEEASRSLERARQAYGETKSSGWYQWSVRVLDARVALRRGDAVSALALCEEVINAPAAPAIYVLHAELTAVEALLSLARIAEAQEHLDRINPRIQPGAMSGTWGEFLRLRGRLHAAAGRATEAYHDFGQSVSVFELLGERYQAALGSLELGRLAGEAGARSRATRYLTEAKRLFEGLGATPDVAETEAVLARLATSSTGGYVGVQADGDDALVRRLVDASAMPALLEREAATALLEACDATAAALVVELPAGRLRVLSAAGTDLDGARTMASTALRATSGPHRVVHSEPIGRDVDGARFAVIAVPKPLSPALRQRFRTLCAVLRQGFELCQARDRTPELPAGALERQLEPLIPGFVCASASMQRVSDQIQRLQGNDLTVLVTGESGTGKDLVARAIHAGSLRRGSMFLPYNCTSATRELADSQLFGHRRGSFTGAVTDQQGLIRSATGGTLFLDEVGDVPIDVQPKLLRFLEQGEVLPVGETRPMQVDVRVVAATNVDLSRAMDEGRFRRDLYDRLAFEVIDLPALRDRLDDIPVLAMHFLERFKEEVSGLRVQSISEAALERLTAYDFPGNVRELKNVVERAVYSSRHEVIQPADIEAALPPAPAAPKKPLEALASWDDPGTPLLSRVEAFERAICMEALEKARYNQREAAEMLGLTYDQFRQRKRKYGLTKE